MRNPLFGASAKQTDDTCNAQLQGLGPEQRGNFPDEAPLAQGPCVTGWVPFWSDGTILEASHDHTTLWLAGRQSLPPAAHACTQTHGAMIVTAWTSDWTRHQSEMQTART